MDGGGENLRSCLRVIAVLTLCMRSSGSCVTV